MLFVGYISQAAKLETHGAPACRSFSLEELKEATKDFDISMCLGEGSMGKVTSRLKYDSEIYNILPETFNSDYIFQKFMINLWS